MKKNWKKFTSWLMLKYLLLACVYSFISPTILLAQETRVLNGQVSTDEGTVPGASVHIKGTTEGAVTDYNGNYSINISMGDTLVFSFLGYLSEELVYNGQDVYNVNLVPDIQNLEQVVVIGYGTQKKSDVTGAVASIDKERLSSVPQSNLGQVLQGAIPGLSITQSSAGADPSSQRILLRGESSISASNTPLVIVDGVPINGDQTNDNNPLSILSDFNQQDIASIEVLKDATSAAIYGARASNGVILITTKKGQSGREVKISYDAYFGLEQIASAPDLMDAEEFYNFRVTRLDSSIITDTERMNYAKGVNTDWVDVALRQGKSMNHSLRLNGGTENMNYYVSGNYQSIEGIAKNDKFDKYTLRTNTELRKGKWLTFGTNTQITWIDKSGAAADFGSDRGAFYFNPMIEPYDSLGNMIMYPWPEQGYFRNPLIPLNYIQEDVTRRVFSNNFIDVKFPFLEGLSYRLNTGLIFSWWNFSEYRGRDTDDGLANNGIAINSYSSNSDMLLENILKYNRDFGKHRLDVTLLYGLQRIKNDYRWFKGQGFTSDDLTYYQVGVAEQQFANARYNQKSYLSQMGRLNYSYDERYLFTFTVRRDGYSAFGANRKYGVFPSFAVGWNMHRESFFSLTALNQLKMRLSYGLTGNQAVPSYATMSRSSAIDFWNKDEMATYGYFPQYLGNEDLGWETSRTLNIGLDYGILDNRINGTVELYNTNTNDLLLYRSISALHGFEPSVLSNVGKIRNKGVEFSINAVPVSTSQFSWTIGLNLSHNKNEILDLYGNGEDDVANGWFIGYPNHVNFGYKFDGIYQEGEDPSETALPYAKPGYAKIADVNNDTLINADDRVILSDRQPNLIGGISNTFSYKNLQLSFFIHFVQGVTRANPYKNWGRTWGEAQRNTINLTYWTSDNPINTFPVNDPNALSGYPVLFYEDASFVRLKDLTLSYTFPEEIINRIRLDNLRVYLSGQNLFTLTSWTGLDPELDGQSSIPLTRKFLVGFNLTF